MKKLKGVGFLGARVLRWPASAISRRCTLLLVGTAYSGCVGSVPVVVYSCGAHRQALDTLQTGRRAPGGLSPTTYGFTCPHLCA